LLVPPPEKSEAELPPVSALLISPVLPDLAEDDARCPDPKEPYRGSTSAPPPFLDEDVDDAVPVGAREGDPER